MSGRPHSLPYRLVPSCIVDGVRITAILLGWEIIGGIFTFGLNEIGVPFGRVWRSLGQLFVLTGVLTGIRYILYRAIDYRRETA